MRVTNNPEEVLITYSLGSCVGLTVFDPQVGVGGLVHCMLPLSRTDLAKAKAHPFMFTDTGIAGLLQAVYDLGAEKRRLIVKVAGGSSLLDKKRMFRIGERNYAVARKILWKNNLLIEAEDVGGSKSRTMLLYMDTGITTIKNHGKEVEL